MRLSEYKGKQLLRQYGILTPKTFHVRNTDEVKAAINVIGDNAVIKAMIPIGGRGKAGLVKIINGIEDAILKSNDIIGKEHSGHLVKDLIIESFISIEHEYYLSIIHDDILHCPVLMFSIDGGVDIEEIAMNTPERIIKIPISIMDGYIVTPIKEIAIMKGVPASIAIKIEKVSWILSKLFIEKDLILAEINPLALDNKGQIIAADCKLEIDDSAIFRHPEYFGDVEKELSFEEKRAKKLGSTLIPLEDGDVGIICNGAGMGMAMLDLFKKYNIRPANFLDSGGGITKEKARKICDIMFEMKDLKALIINLWGSITLLDKVAFGIIESLEFNKPDFPVIARLQGNGMEEAMKLLEDKGIQVARVTDTEDAIKILAQVIKKRGL